MNKAYGYMKKAASYIIALAIAGVLILSAKPECMMYSIGCKGLDAFLLWIWNAAVNFFALIGFIFFIGEIMPRRVGEDGE